MLKDVFFNLGDLNPRELVTVGFVTTTDTWFVNCHPMKLMYDCSAYMFVLWLNWCNRYVLKRSVSKMY